MKSHWLFFFTVPFSLAEKKMPFRAKNGAIREYIAPLRANQIARMTSDFKMDLIKGVIARVNSKSDEREARGRFEITNTITFWIVRHEVQLLINRIYNKFRSCKCLLRTVLFSEKVCYASPTLFKTLKTVGNSAKEATKARVIDVRITWVLNYRCPTTKSSNRTPVIGHPRDLAPITWQVGPRKTNHVREFCYGYDLYCYYFC